ncbi:MAG: TonB-dependent receptor plug domain-containing protein, partial [Caulobacter sp.]|nr:TonB-dependent receptor plug domain-containing protein [Caulobacter sp.]
AMRYGASALALGAVAIGLTPTLAFAQAAAPGQQAQATTADDTAVTEVVVTGVRQALKSAQQLKRDADTVVDSITASDIGAFPDKSVAEALQRVAGITVNRFAATSDTAHFSAEPSGVIVRGLPQVRSEFNGRDSFTANSSRGLGWGDISPELMAGVDAYKNQTAELIEGGIAGTINLRTRTPFDSTGRLFSLSVDASYGDLADRVTPSVSGIWSDRWDTAIGEFGLMANYAYSKVVTNSEGIQYGRTAIFDEGIYAGKGLKYIPSSVSFRDNTYDRTRNGAAFAAQWQDHDHKFLATLQYNRSEYENTWHEYVATASPFSLFAQPTGFHVKPGSTLIPQPAPGTPDFTFDDQGNFQTGVMTSDIGWWGLNDAESAQIAQNSAGQPMVNACYGWNGCTPARRGGDFSTDTRYSTGTNVTEDLGFNLKWNPTDQWRFNFDVQKVESTVDNYDIGVGQQSFANIGLRPIPVRLQLAGIAEGRRALRRSRPDGALGQLQLGQHRQHLEQQRRLVQHRPVQSVDHQRHGLHRLPARPLRHSPLQRRLLRRRPAVAAGVRVLQPGQAEGPRRHAAGAGHGLDRRRRLERPVLGQGQARGRGRLFPAVGNPQRFGGNQGRLCDAEVRRRQGCPVRTHLLGQYR